MPVLPPKCRNCGVQEWRHLCKGAVDIKSIETKAKSAGAKAKSKPTRKGKPNEP